MSTVNINPYPVIFGLDGLPVEEGYIYIGDPDVDPVAHPKTVYWDVGQTLPAEQPLRTLGGRVWRAGSLALLYITGHYSIQVLDKNGAQILINLNVTPL